MFISSRIWYSKDNNQKLVHSNIMFIYRLSVSFFFAPMLSLISSTIRSMYVYHAWSDIIPLMPSYRFNCMCLQFLFLYTSSCYSFLTSASLWLSFCCLLLLLCICLYDVSYARLFSGVKFYFFFFEKILFKI